MTTRERWIFGFFANFWIGMTCLLSASRTAARYGRPTWYPAIRTIDAMETIVFLERDTLQAKFRRPTFEHEWIDYGETLASQTVERLRGATIVISNKLPLREADLSQLPDLKLIAIAATGFDNIDLDYCRAQGITVCNTRGYAASSVPEHVLMFILALRRNLLAYRQDVQAGKWQQSKQ